MVMQTSPKDEDGEKNKLQLLHSKGILEKNGGRTKCCSEMEYKQI